MIDDDLRHSRPESSGLHPFVYWSIAGLTLWLVVSAWAFFDDGPYTGFLLAVVTGFFFMFVALPVLLWRVWRKHAADTAGGHQPFREWARGECVTWQCRLSGAEAAVQALLPIAAAAVGMTAIGIIFAFVAIYSGA
jgi:hypothetical protein